jgi:hypothetical protein
MRPAAMVPMSSAPDYTLACWRHGKGSALVDRLGVAPDRTLMVGNNRLADSGSICIGCHCLILPPVPPGATRGLRAAVDMAGIPWAR